MEEVGRSFTRIWYVFKSELFSSHFKILLVYFGTIYTTHPVHGEPEVIKDTLDWTSTITKADGTREILGKLCKGFQEAIVMDLQRLKQSGIVTTTR